jgi:hypothetical protein
LTPLLALFLSDDESEDALAGSNARVLRLRELSRPVGISAARYADATVETGRHGFAVRRSMPSLGNRNGRRVV